METLSEYVARIMRQEGLSAREIERRSGKAITDAYVMQIVNGSTSNVSIVKAQALARGLGVDEDELFRIARGVAPKAKVRGKSSETLSARALAKAIEGIVANPEVAGVVQLLLGLPPRKLGRLLKIIEREGKRAELGTLPQAAEPTAAYSPDKEADE